MLDFNKSSPLAYLAYLAYLANLVPLAPLDNLVPLANNNPRISSECGDYFISLLLKPLEQRSV